MTLRPLRVPAVRNGLICWQMSKNGNGCLKGAYFLRPCPSFKNEMCGLDPVFVNKAFRDELFEDTSDAKYVRNMFIALAKGLSGLDARIVRALVCTFGALKVEPGEARTMKSTQTQVHAAGASDLEYLLGSDDVCKKFEKDYRFGLWLNEACAPDCGVTPVVQGVCYTFPEVFTLLRHE